MAEKFISIDPRTGLFTAIVTCDKCKKQETVWSDAPEELDGDGNLAEGGHDGGYSGWDMVPGRKPYRDLCDPCREKLGLPKTEPVMCAECGKYQRLHAGEPRCVHCWLRSRADQVTRA